MQHLRRSRVPAKEHRTRMRVATVETRKAGLPVQSGRLSQSKPRASTLHSTHRSTVHVRPLPPAINRCSAGTSDASPSLCELPTDAWTPPRTATATALVACVVVLGKLEHKRVKASEDEVPTARFRRTKRPRKSINRRGHRHAVTPSLLADTSRRTHNNPKAGPCTSSRVRRCIRRPAW